MTAVHTLGILSTSFMRNAFPTVLKEFPHMLSTCCLLFIHFIQSNSSLTISCWLLFLHSAVQLVLTHLSWFEAGSSDAALHHSPWSNSPYSAWRCVLGHCPVEEQIIVPLSANQKGWRIAAECCGSHADSVSPTHLLLHASRWELHMQRSAVYVLCVSQRHGSWNQKSQMWTQQPKGQLSISLKSIARVSWPKQVSSYWCALVVFFAAIRPRRSDSPSLL